MERVKREEVEWRVHDGKKISCRESWVKVQGPRLPTKSLHDSDNAIADNLHSPVYPLRVI